MLDCMLLGAEITAAPQQRRAQRRLIRTTLIIPGWVPKPSVARASPPLSLSPATGATVSLGRPSRRRRSRPPYARPLRLSQAKAASSAKEVARPVPADARRLRAAPGAVLACSSSPIALRRAAVSCAAETRAPAGLSPSLLLPLLLVVQAHAAGGRPGREQGHMARPAAAATGPPPPPPASPAPIASLESRRRFAELLGLPRRYVWREACHARASHAG